MAREKFNVGEPVEVLCEHVRDGQVVHTWLRGMVVERDERMAGIVFQTDVFSSNGWRIPDRTLWCAHGSRHIRRCADASTAPAGADPSSTA